MAAASRDLVARRRARGGHEGSWCVSGVVGRRVSSVLCCSCSCCSCSCSTSFFSASALSFPSCHRARHAHAASSRRASPCPPHPPKLSSPRWSPSTPSGRDVTTVLLLGRVQLRAPGQGHRPGSDAGSRPPEPRPPPGLGSPWGDSSAVDQITESSRGHAHLHLPIFWALAALVSWRSAPAGSSLMKPAPPLALCRYRWRCLPLELAVAGKTDATPWRLILKSNSPTNPLEQRHGDQAACRKNIWHLRGAQAAPK